MKKDDIFAQEAIGLLKKYGRMEVVMREINCRVDQLYKLFNNPSFKGFRNFPLMYVKSDGKTAIITPPNIGEYIHEYGLKSMNFDLGFLEHELSLALDMVDRQKDKQIVHGTEMVFYFRKKRYNNRNVYQIARLRINLKCDLEEGFPRLTYFGNV